MVVTVARENVRVLIWADGILDIFLPCGMGVVELPHKFGGDPLDLYLLHLEEQPC